jgi:hypothetical protein
MPRLIRPLLAVAVVAFASFARADAPRLLAPADGATLRGGSFAELRWSAAQLPASVEEWEAFLSIDGGKYYAFRVTPHLDIDLRRFTFIVPNVDAGDARILIRIGDEVRETHFEARGSFAIVRDPGAEQLFPRLLQFGRGEAARDGDPEVLAWAEGARNGAGVTQQTSTAVPSPSLSRPAAATSDPPDVLAPAQTSFDAPSIAGAQPSARYKHANKAIEQLAIPADLLLICRRRNI